VSDFRFIRVRRKDRDGGVYDRSKQRSQFIGKVSVELSFARFSLDNSEQFRIKSFSINSEGKRCTVTQKINSEA
jgi:hypothetical protein